MISAFRGKLPTLCANSVVTFGCCGNHLPARAPDNEVIAKAQELDSILVSLNGDFADIVTYPPASYGGIVAIQLHDHPEIIPMLMAGLGGFVAEHLDQSYYRGKLFIVEPHRIRIRS